MPSSTSSSSDRLPEGRSGTAWITAIAIVLSGLAIWEAVLRSAGFPAEVTPAVWSIARSRASEGVPVIVGASRIQSGLDLDAWVDARGGPKPAQLAVAGGSALPVLEELASDPGVDGFVLVDAMPFHTFDVSGMSAASLAGLEAGYERYRVSPAVRIETHLRVWVTSRMAWRNPAVDPGALLAALASGGGLPEPPQSVLRPDRFRPIDFASSIDGRDWTSEEGFAAGGDSPLVREFGRPADPDEVSEIVRRLDSAARRIRDRGGRVVFITMPACGRRLPIEEARYPRVSYWDRLAEGTSARTINTADYPELSGFPCYDGSHLDYRDAPRFTRRLVELLFEQGG